MEWTILVLLLNAILGGVVARATPHGPDCRTDYLHHILGTSKLRPKVNGELNFSPNKGEFSNTVRSIAGKRVAGNDEYQFQLTLLPMANTRIVKSVSVVIHFPHNSTRDQGREIQLYVKCENLTAVQPIQFHTVNGTSKWIELGIKATRIPCSTTDECVFFVKISGDPSALETILIVYDYAKFGGFESDTLEKRSTDYIANKTLLTDLQANGINCSVNSVFLNYATELRIFDGTQEVISPNSIGINMTYCYGTCDLDYTLPANLTSAERVHFLHNLLQDVQHTPLLGACCVPDEIENDDLLISSMNGQVIELQTFPQVVSCKCMI